MKHSIALLALLFACGTETSPPGGQGGRPGSGGSMPGSRGSTPGTGDRSGAAGGLVAQQRPFFRWSGAGGSSY